MSHVAFSSRRSPVRILGAALAMLLSLAATPAFADDAIFRWRDDVRCGPDGTLRFDGGAQLVLPDTDTGVFEFRGQAREEASRGEDYVLTLTFRDRDGRILFELASEPFEMLSGRTSRVVVVGQENLVARYWEEVEEVELDCQVPNEPLFEDAWDFYGYVVRYARDQELEAREFGG
jgi:hypothetical protein